jgi:uncharacterized protein YecT (DUF1311 family)
MMKIQTIIVLASLLGMSSLSLAANCDQTRNSLDAVHCSNLVYQQADQELNKTYKALMGKLKATDKKNLRTLQRQWIRQRDQACTMQSVDMGEVINSSCLLDQTTERTNWLTDRLRECKTVGCISSKFVP